MTKRDWLWLVTAIIILSAVLGVIMALALAAG